MFLGIDIGNTTTMLGLYDDHSVKPEKTYRIKTDKRGDDAELAGSIRMALRSDAAFETREAEITG
jgi:pantothenate kinase type III